MPGESLHESGRRGVEKATQWLDSTGRVQVLWNVYDDEAQLRIVCPSKLERSFDLTAKMMGSKHDRSQLYAEVKHVHTPSGLAGQDGDFLANCYCKMLPDTEQRYEFMFITWHPFSLRSWTCLTKGETVERALKKRQTKWLGNKPIDKALCKKVADRVWIIVLSDKMLHLCMTRTKS